MSRPRPPLHDPYGLLRPPPPQAATSLYSVTSNALTSTTSLPIPTSLPNRRGRQRGISPSRTQYGEEYEDQPYLTNVVRHHGQVTLIPPVNQGRTRKARRRRNPKATASAISLADTLAGSSNSSGPSRVSAARSRSPRRRRQGAEARAVSSPDVRATSYPDYPPPSFEEVLALDRNNAPSSTTSPSTNDPAGANDVPSPMFLVSAPPSLSDPAHDPVTTAMPWERDRLMGFTLEERVRREYERNLKQSSGSGLALPTDDAISPPRPHSPAPVPSSPTATSVTASNFLTPQNLSPSALGADLPLSAANSPKASESPRSPSPPPLPSKSPEFIDTSPTRATGSVLDRDAGPSVRNPPTQSQALEPVESNEPSVGSSEAPLESVNSDSVLSQGTLPGSEVSLTSLLFTTRLRLDTSPERSPVREHRREPSPIREGRSTTEAETSQLATTGTLENNPGRSPFARVHPAPLAVPIQKTASGPSRTTSPIRNSSPIRSPAIPRPPSPKLLSPIGSSLPVNQDTPSRGIPEPSQSPPSTTPRRPPPPPPRLRQRQVGSGVEARISAYETLLANAPKVPPPIPPRPRPRSQTTLEDVSVAQPAGDVPERTPTCPDALIQRMTGSPRVESLTIPRDTHTVTPPSTATQRPRPPRPTSVHVTTQLTRAPPRPTSVVSQDALSPDPSQPQSDRLGTRPLPVPRPERPERPVSMSMNVQTQVPVLSRSGSVSLGEQGPDMLGDTHTTARSTTATRPQPLSRPASVVHQTATPPTLTSPQLQSTELGSRPLPAPVPSRPERPVSVNIQPQALVPARIGPDGKLEIIPDAEVIWLDEANARPLESHSRPSGSRTQSARSPPPPSVPPQSTAGPSSREAEVNPFEDSFLGPPAVAPAMSRQSSTTSSVNQPLSPGQSHPLISDPGPSTSALTTDLAAVSPPAHLADDFEYTDLDLLISRLEENEASRQGANYEQLLTVGEVLGPAHPPPPRPDFDLNVGLIEIQRRRVMKDGRVKLKLSLMGVGVDKCGICLTQFKNNESAVLLPCLHSFHTNCIMSWFVRQDAPACPHCRAPVTQ